MARLKTIKEDGKTTFALLIDHSVGVKGRNRRDDVQLIQFLLNSANKNGVSPFAQKLSEDLKMDGICGPKTIAAIRLYQKTINEFSHDTLVEDGTINASEKRSFSRGGHILNTAIGHLNFYFRSIFEHQIRKAWGNQPLTDAILEPLVKMHLLP